MLWFVHVICELADRIQLHEFFIGKRGFALRANIVFLVRDDKIYVIRGE